MSVFRGNRAGCACYLDAQEGAEDERRELGAAAKYGCLVLLPVAVLDEAAVGGVFGLRDGRDIRHQRLGLRQDHLRLGRCLQCGQVFARSLQFGEERVSVGNERQQVIGLPLAAFDE